MRLSLAAQAGSEAQDLPLRRKQVSIGSASDNTIRIKSGSVAAHHARLRRYGGDWLLEDLGSPAGTYLNGIRVLGSQVIRPGDRITCGCVALDVVAEPGDGPRRAERPESKAGWLGASLALLLCLGVMLRLLPHTVPVLPQLAWVATALPAPTATALPAVPPATATRPATATATAAPAYTATASATAAPTATATITPTPDEFVPTLLAMLTAAPADRAQAAVATLTAFGTDARQQALVGLESAIATSPSEGPGVWLDGLLGTPTPPPLVGRIALGRYVPAADRYDLIVHDLATGQETALLSQASQPAFSPDGSRVAYHSWQADALGLYLASADGSQRWILTRDPHPEDGQPAWAPDGSKVAFSSLRYGDGKSRIYLVPAQGGIASGICFGEYVDWAPDGVHIAFKGCIGGSCGIIVANDDGSGQRLITSDASDGAPAWSPDGGWIAFQSAREGNWGIYVMRADGSDVVRLTSSDTAEKTLPRWSPDGSYVAFRSNQDAEWGVWAVPLRIDAAGKVQVGSEMHLFASNLRPGDEMRERFVWLP